MPPPGPTTVTSVTTGREIGMKGCVMPHYSTELDSRAGRKIPEEKYRKENTTGIITGSTGKTSCT
jgi:hypothetical protein